MCLLRCSKKCPTDFGDGKWSGASKTGDKEYRERAGVKDADVLLAATTAIYYIILQYIDRYIMQGYI